MTFYYTLRSRLQKVGLKSSRQCDYNINKWPKAKRIIAAGGCIGHESFLENLKRRYAKTPERVAILGIDFLDITHNRKLCDYLNQISFISTRNPGDFLRLKQLIPNIQLQPDLAFCLNTTTIPDPNQISGLGINITNVQGVRLVSGEFVFSHAPTEDSTMGKSHKENIYKGYQFICRSLVQQALDSGKKIYHIPFTPADNDYAKYVLSKLSVTYLPYTCRPEVASSYFRLFSEFVATRFHSIIFALLHNKPVKVLAYAWKCESLCREMGIPDSSYISLSQIAKHVTWEHEPILYSTYCRADPIRVSNCTEQCDSMIKIALKRLQLY